MTRLPVPVAVLALLVAGCGSSTPDADLAPLAEQADRVAALLDDDRPCEAATAAQELRTMARADVSGEVRDVVTAFADDAASAITCPPAPTDTPASDAGSSEGRDDGGGDDRDDKGGDDKDEDDKDEDDKKDGRGPPPGRGEGRGGGR